MELQLESKNKLYLWEYLCSLPVDDIGVPVYYPLLSRELRDLKYRNLIYPVSSDAFVHIYPNPEDSRDRYIAIEPSNIPSVPDLMQRVDKHMMNCVDRLKLAEDAAARTELLMTFLDEICTVDSSRFQRKTIKVTDRELSGLKYLQLRDKEGMGALDPIINDAYIEDISCDGVGPLFLEHKIFGGLEANIRYDSTEELDRFVIKLSEVNQTW